MPSRFSFASFSTYRKGSPRYRRAFSAYVNSLYIRHTGDARVSSAQPACGRCSRGSAPSSVPEAPRGRSPRYACPLRRQRSVPQRLSMLGWLCGRSAPPSAPGGASRTEPPLRMSATPLRFSAATDPADADSVPPPPPPGPNRAHDPAPATTHQPHRQPPGNQPPPTTPPSSHPPNPNPNPPTPHGTTPQTKRHVPSHRRYQQARSSQHPPHTRTPRPTAQAPSNPYQNAPPQPPAPAPRRAPAAQWHGSAPQPYAQHHPESNHPRPPCRTTTPHGGQNPTTHQTSQPGTPTNHEPTTHTPPPKPTPPDAHASTPPHAPPTKPPYAPAPPAKHPTPPNAPTHHYPKHQDSTTSTPTASHPNPTPATSPHPDHDEPSTRATHQSHDPTKTAQTPAEPHQYRGTTANTPTTNTPTHPPPRPHCSTPKPPSKRPE